MKVIILGIALAPIVTLSMAGTLQLHAAQNAFGPEMYGLDYSAYDVPEGHFSGEIEEGFFK